MAELTDPAQEFALLCSALRTEDNAKGANYLAAKFDTAPYSFHFYQVLFTIIERAEFLRQITAQLPEAEHVAPQIEKNIKQILKAFEAPNLAQPWRTHGAPYLNDANISPILIFSVAVRKKFAYPLLTEDEQSELVGVVEELISWLDGHQIGEQDFIRQALIEGLRQFKFRVERLRWMGWGYTLQSLREVISAYMALERGFTTEGEMPLVAAVLKKTAQGLRKIYSTAGVAKEVFESGDFILKAYGAASMVINAKVAGIAGVLTFTNATG